MKQNICKYRKNIVDQKEVCKNLRKYSSNVVSYSLISNNINVIQVLKIILRFEHQDIQKILSSV